MEEYIKAFWAVSKVYLIINLRYIYINILSHIGVNRCPGLKSAAFCYLIVRTSVNRYFDSNQQLKGQANHGNNVNFNAKFT